MRTIHTLTIYEEKSNVLIWNFENICGSGSEFRIEWYRLKSYALKFSHNSTTCSVHRKTSPNLFAFLHNQHMSNFSHSHFLARFWCFAHSLSRTHTRMEIRSHSHMHTYACTRRSHLCVRAHSFWMYRHDFRNLFFRTFSMLAQTHFLSIKMLNSPPRLMCWT